MGLKIVTELPPIFSPPATLPEPPAPATPDEVREAKREEARGMLRKYAELKNEIVERDREYAGFLDELIRTRPRVLALRREQEQLNQELHRYEERIKAASKELKEAISAAGFLCRFEDPKRDEISGVILFKLCPEAKEIADLWWPEINPVVFKAAVAAGKIPKEVADQALTRISTTTAGRSQIVAI